MSSENLKDCNKIITDRDWSIIFQALHNFSQQGKLAEEILKEYQMHDDKVFDEIHLKELNIMNLWGRLRILRSRLDD